MAAQENVGGVRMEAELDTSKLDQGVKKVGDSLQKLDPTLKKTEQEFKNVEQASHGAGQGAEGMGLSFRKLFPALTAANLATSAITRTVRGMKDAFVGAIKGAIDFQAALIQTQKVTGATKGEMADLKKFIRDLAVQTGITKGELADIAAGGGRLGIFAREGPEGLKIFTETIAKSRIAMQDYAVSSDEASDKTARLLNLFNLRSKDAEELLSIINSLSNTAAATSANIADNVTNFASLSQTFDASKESLLALATTMEEVGSEPQAFTTAFQTALIKMQADTDKFANYLGPKLGDEFKKAFEKKPVEGFMLFLQGLGKAGRDVGKVLQSMGIGDARMIRELSKLSTDRALELFSKNLGTAEGAAKDAQDAVNGLAGAASSLQIEFERASDATKRHLQSLSEAASNAGQSFGDGFLPVINEVSDTMTGWLQGSIDLARVLGETIGDLIGTTAALAASFGDTIGRFVKMGAAIVRQPFEDMGLAEKGASARLAKDALFGTDPGAKMLARIQDARKVAQEARRQFGFDSGASGSGGDFPGGDLPADEEGRAAAAQKAEKAEQNLLKALGEQAKIYKEHLDARKEELELKRDIGTLTEKESRELDRINHRIDYQKDNVKEATDAWKEQAKVVEKLQKEVAKINEDIISISDELQKQLKQIDQDATKRKAEKILELMQEKSDLEGQVARREGLSLKEQERLKEIEDTLKRAQVGDEAAMQIKRQLENEQKQLLAIRAVPGAKLSLYQSDRLAEIEQKLTQYRDIGPLTDAFNQAKDYQKADEFQQIGLDAEEQKRQAAIDHNEKLAELTLELTEKTNDLTAAQQSERDAVDAVTKAIEDNKTQADINFKLLEERTKQHVDTQVAEFNRLLSALRGKQQAYLGLTSSESAIFSSVSPGFAGGGPVIGPGSGKSDSINARLSNGEHVLTASEVQLMGGQAAVLNFRSLLRTMPRFAEGGPVTNDNSKSATITINNHGRAAESFTDPRRAKWYARTYL